MAERTKRTERKQTGSKVIIGARFEDVAMGLRAAGCVNTSGIAILGGFPSANSTNKWVRGPVNAGLFAPHVSDLAEENAYTLTSKGWAVLVERFSELRDAPFTPVRAPTPHRLLSSSFWIRLAADVRKDGRLRLLAWPEEALRGEARGGIVPDLLVQLPASRTLTYAVEADIGTENNGVIAQKATAYESAHATGKLFNLANWRVAWIVPNATRAKVLARVLREHTGSVEHLVGTMEEMVATGALHHPWLNVKTGASCMLVPELSGGEVSHAAP